MFVTCLSRSGSTRTPVRAETSANTPPCPIPAPPPAPWPGQPSLKPRRGNMERLPDMTLRWSGTPGRAG
jgi:hypothetical protein